jgi:uncharacterized Zn-finger protein
VVNKTSYFLKRPNLLFRPYQCDVCGTSYRSKGSLRKHIFRGHKDDGLANIVFKCKDCDMTFSYLGTLRRHERSVHNKIPEDVKPISQVLLLLNFVSLGLYYKTFYGRNIRIFMIS